jgi:hypothetical protein
VAQRLARTPTGSYPQQIRKGTKAPMTLIPLRAFRQAQTWQPNNEDCGGQGEDAKVISLATQTDITWG